MQLKPINWAGSSAKFLRLSFYQFGLVSLIFLWLPLIQSSAGKGLLLANAPTDHAFGSSELDSNDSTKLILRAVAASEAEEIVRSGPPEYSASQLEATSPTREKFAVNSVSKACPNNHHKTIWQRIAPITQLLHQWTRCGADGIMAQPPDQFAFDLDTCNHWQGDDNSLLSGLIIERPQASDQRVFGNTTQDASEQQNLFGPESGHQIQSCIVDDFGELAAKHSRADHFDSGLIANATPDRDPSGNPTPASASGMTPPPAEVEDDWAVEAGVTLACVAVGSMLLAVLVMALRLVLRRRSTQ